MQPLNRQLAYSDEVIEHLAAQNARVQRLRTVPSIGPVTAAAFVATLDDAQRFHHAHQVEASLGLVPREFSSGESQRRDVGIQVPPVDALHLQRDVTCSRKTSATVRGRLMAGSGRWRSLEDLPPA